MPQRTHSRTRPLQENITQARAAIKGEASFIVAHAADDLINLIEQILARSDVEVLRELQRTETSGNGLQKMPAAEEGAR